MSDFIDLAEKYSKELKGVFADDFRIDYENSCIILDGNTEEFFFTLDGDDEVRLYWCNECFIFSRGRNLFTSSDTYGEIVYEGDIDINVLPDIIINLVINIKDCVFVSKKEIVIDKIPSGYDSRKNYFIKAKSFEKTGTSYKLANIEINFL